MKNVKIIAYMLFFTGVLLIGYGFLKIGSNSKELNNGNYDGNDISENDNNTENMKKYIVTFDNNGGTNIENQVVIEKHTVIKPQNPTKKGYKFVEWQLNGKTYDFSTPVMNDLTLVALWDKEKKQYIVKFDFKDDTNVISQDVFEGEKAKRPINPTKNGYTFVEWQLNGKTYDFNSVVNNNITLIAVWKKEDRKQYNVVFESNSESKVVNQYVVEGEKAKRPINPTKDGYTFVEWQLNGKTYDFNSTVNSNITLNAIWKENPKKTYTVTFNSNGGSNVSSETVVEGNKVAKPADPTKSGYTFVGWQLNGKTYDFNSTVNSNITLTASWTETIYTIKSISVDPYSPDITLKVYDGTTEVKNYKSINYGSDSSIVMCLSSNPTVGRSDFNDETSFVVVLNDGTKIKATK